MYHDHVYDLCHRHRNCSQLPPPQPGHARNARVGKSVCLFVCLSAVRRSVSSSLWLAVLQSDVGIEFFYVDSAQVSSRRIMSRLLPIIYGVSVSSSAGEDCNMRVAGVDPAHVSPRPRSFPPIPAAQGQDARARVAQSAIAQSHLQCQGR